MFLERFTFNTNVTGDNDGQTYSSINEDFVKLKTPNFVYKKVITFSVNKTFGIIKKYIGLGDIVEFITKYTGIKYIIIKITKGNCGCEKRRIKFNSFLAIPYFLIYFKEATVNDLYKLESNTNKYPIQSKKHTEEDLGNMLPKKGCGCGTKK